MRFLLLPFLGIALATLDSRQIKDCQFIGPSKTACHLGRNDSSATVMKLTKDNYYQFACTGLGESKGHGEKNNSYWDAIIIDPSHFCYVWAGYVPDISCSPEYLWSCD